MDRLYFYIGSVDKYPGKGVHEHVNDPSLYRELSHIDNWRRMFSPHWECEIDYKGSKYKSVEHAFAAEKFRINGYDEVASKFTLDSNNPISQLTPIEVAPCARKIHILNEAELEKWEERRRNIKLEIYLAKFQDPLLKQALLLTKNAELHSLDYRTRTTRNVTLERVRELLRTS